MLFSRSHFHPPRCGGSWSKFSMVRLTDVTRPRRSSPERRREKEEHKRYRESPERWSAASLRRPLAVLALLALPAILPAQTQATPAPPDVSSILARLDRLEKENRAMAEEIQSLR